MAFGSPCKNKKAPATQEFNDFSAFCLIFGQLYCPSSFNGKTKFGGGEGTMKTVCILFCTHIPLAAIILPFILFTAYHGLIGEYATHKDVPSLFHYGCM